MLEAIILGLVQGLTEFFPVSSSGHLVLFQHVMLTAEQDRLLLDLWLHVGTLVAVVIYYRNDLTIMSKSLAPGGNSEQRQLVAKLMVATLITAAIGLSIKDQVEELFYQPQWATGFLALTGFMLLTTHILAPKTTGTKIEWSKVVIIAIAQGFAVLPGVSRSGATILTAVLLGISRPEAARFSFLLSVPAIAGAAVLVTKDAIQTNPGSIDWAPIFAGAAVAATVGYITIAAFVKIVERYLWFFGAYCLLVGAAASVYFATQI